MQTSLKHLETCQKVPKGCSLKLSIAAHSNLSHGFGNGDIALGRLGAFGATRLPVPSAAVGSDALSNDLQRLHR